MAVITKHPKKIVPDNISGDHNIYKEVFLSAAKWMACLALGYEFICQMIALLWNNPAIDSGYLLASVILFFCGITDPTHAKIIEVAEIILEFVGLFLGYELIFNKLLEHKERTWNKENKHMLIAGKWLHVHDKEQIRIGVITFVQKFSSVAIDEAFNVSPISEDVEDSGKTTWGYTTARLYPQDLPGVEFIATYTTRKDNGGSNTGTHIFDTVNLDSQGFPASMTGKFCDTFEVINDKADPASKRGKLALYRMSPEIEAHIYGPNGLDEDKLRNLINDPDFANTDFVRAVKTAIVNQKQLRTQREQAKQAELEAAAAQAREKARLEAEQKAPTKSREISLLQALTELFREKPI